MKKNYFYQFALLFLICQFTALFAAAQAKKVVVVNKTLTPATTTTTPATIAVPNANPIDVSLQGVPAFQCISATVQHQDASNGGNKNIGTITKNPDNNDVQLFKLESQATVIHDCKIIFNKKSTTGQLSVSKTMLLTGVIITGKTVNPDKSISYKIVSQTFTTTSE
jgi:hypothetical protein